MHHRRFYVYIMTNKPQGVLYIGVTNDIARRVWEHQQKIHDGFTARYNLDKLVYCEEIPSIEGAIMREKRLKRWNRDWKISLIEDVNPEWKDLSKEF